MKRSRLKCVARIPWFAPCFTAFTLHQRYGNCGRSCRAKCKEGFSSTVICQSDEGDNAMVGREADDSNLCWAWRTKRDGQIPARDDSGSLGWLRWLRWLGGYLGDLGRFKLGGLTLGKLGYLRGLRSTPTFLLRVPWGKRQEGH